MLTCGISAAWAAEQHVTVAPTTGGTVTVDKATAAAGETVTITVTPDAGYQIAKSDIVAEATIDPGNAQAPGLKADGPNVGYKIELQGDDPASLKEARTYTFTMPDAPLNVLITAHFSGVLDYNITISPDIVNGTVTSDKAKASYQETVILTVTPAEGYELATLQATWIEGGTQNAIDATFAGNGMYTFEMPAHDVTVMATFTKKPYNITVDDGIEHGSVVAPATAYYGDQVAVTATPDVGYELTSLKATWYEYGTSETSVDLIATGNGSYTFEMPAYNVTIEATFTKKPYNITVADGIEHGSVTAPATACMGDQVTLTVTPDPGYEVATLQATSLVGGSITAINPTPQGNGIYTFEMPARDVTIEATFTKKLYNIGIADGIEHGSISAPATAHYDDPVTVTVTPDKGYELDHLYYSYDAGGGVHEPEITIENGQFNMPNFDVTIHATFKLKKYNVEVEEAIDGDHGFVQAVPSTCSMGETVTLITSADTGYAITTLQATYEEGTTEVNLPLTPAENDTYTFVMPAADVHVHWIVSKVQYTITVNPSEHGTVTAPATAEYGQEVTLTVTPDAHYMLESLSVAYTNGNPVTVTDNKFSMPAANVVVNATFKPVTYNITVAPTEHGTVTAPESAAYGSEVTVSVAPEEAYELETLTYTVDGGQPVPIENGKFTMPGGNVTITATFKPATYTITVAPTEHGTVSAPATAAYGTEVNVTVTPDPGYEIDELYYTYDAGGSVTDPIFRIENGKFVMPGTNVTIVATFKPATYTITVAPTEHGTVSAPATAAYGTEVNVTVTPDEGYELDELVVMPAYNSVTCAEVIAGADDMIYRVSGKITHISSMEYGNLYLADNTGEIFIYGTLDKEGNTNNFESLGLKEGDYVIVEGPKTTYQGIVELIDVTVVGVEIETNVTGNGYTFTMPACDVVVSATFKSTSHTYTVAGEPAALFGSETPWDVNNSNGEMTAGDGGIYTWTSQPTHLEGDVMFKIVTDKNWNNPSYPADNYIISNVKPGTYTVTITLNPATGEINVNVVGQADVFVIGQINGNTQFAPNDGLQMTTEDGKIYTAQVTIADIEAGYGFFAFTHKLGANADDWNTVNAYRFMAESYYDFLVTGSTMNSQLPIDYKDNSAMKIPAGEYTLTVDLENMHLTINGGTQLSYILASGVEGVDYTVINDLTVVEKSDVTKQYFTSDGNDNWITLNSSNYYNGQDILGFKGGRVSGVFGGKNLNPYLTISTTPTIIEDAQPVEPASYSLANPFSPKVDEVIIVSKAYYKASENTLRAYAPGGAQGQSCTVDNSLFSYDFEDGKQYTVRGVINIKEPWATPSGISMMDYDYPFQNYKLLVTDVTEEPPTTAINNIYLEEGVKSVRFYNAAGVESNVPFPGVNIVVKEMNDGSKVTTKVIK